MAEQLTIQGSSLPSIFKTGDTQSGRYGEYRKEPERFSMAADNGAAATTNRPEEQRAGSGLLSSMRRTITERARNSADTTPTLLQKREGIRAYRSMHTAGSPAARASDTGTSAFAPPRAARREDASPGLLSGLRKRMTDRDVDNGIRQYRMVEAMRDRNRTLTERLQNDDRFDPSGDYFEGLMADRIERIRERTEDSVRPGVMDTPLTTAG